MTRKHKQEKVVVTLKKLKEAFPDQGAMEYGNAYEGLVGVLLSARTRDEQVLKLLPDFFTAYPNPQVLAEASVEEIASHINTIGMYRQKAKHLKGMAERLVSVYGGEVPQTLDELVTLPGVGRKTASVILPAHFDVPAIAVDTHVHRVTNRLEWVRTKFPAQTEGRLLKLIPPAFYRIVNQVFVPFGRYICLPGRPRCWACPIADVCPVKNKNLDAPKDADAILSRIDVQRAEVQRLKAAVEDVTKHRLADKD